jgi:plasmid stabilization system protein ParE
VARIRVTRAARRDLDEIADYFRAHAPAAARRVHAVIFAKLDLIAQFPEIGPVVAKRGERQYRRTVAGDYAIWYRVIEAGIVRVLAVRHGRRRPLSPNDLDLRSPPEP